MLKNFFFESPYWLVLMRRTEKCSFLAKKKPKREKKFWLIELFY